MLLHLSVFCLQEVSNVYEADYMKEDIFRNADHLVKALCLTGAEGEKESNKKKKNILWLKKILKLLHLNTCVHPELN